MKTAIATCMFLTIGACAPVVDTTDTTIDGTTYETSLPQGQFQCADGRTVAAAATVAGMSVLIDSTQSLNLQQIDNTDLGFVFQSDDGRLGWVQLHAGGGRLADLGSGEVMTDASGVACTAVQP